MVSAAQNERIQKIRDRRMEEKQLVSTLDGTLTDAHLKAILKLASNWLDDVETFFLDTKILQEPRRDSALAAWLDQAERVLQNAVQQRKFVEDIVKTYGVNARIIP
jgi:hypothetical protein